MIILDTNVLSELTKLSPAPEVLHWFSRRTAEELFTTTITEAEMRFGIELLPNGKHRISLESAIAAMFKEFGERILSFDRPAAFAFSAIAARRRKLGRPISQSDAQIAAIVRSFSAILATRNETDFDHCEIKITNPWVTMD